MYMNSIGRKAEAVSDHSALPNVRKPDILCLQLRLRYTSMKFRKKKIYCGLASLRESPFFRNVEHEGMRKIMPQEASPAYRRFYRTTGLISSSQ